VPCSVPATSLPFGTVKMMSKLQFKNGEDLKTVRTQWLVGCDGMHGVVREQASIPFIGGDYEESFVLANVAMDWPLDRQEVSLFFSDKGLIVVAPLPGNHLRIVATMKEAPPEPSIADLQYIFEERALGANIDETVPRRDSIPGASARRPWRTRHRAVS